VFCSDAANWKQWIPHLKIQWNNANDFLNNPNSIFHLTARLQCPSSLSNNICISAATKFWHTKLSLGSTVLLAENSKHSTLEQKEMWLHFSAWNFYLVFRNMSKIFQQCSVYQIHCSGSILARCYNSCKQSVRYLKERQWQIWREGDFTMDNK
jgi:hypothetical protein